MHIPDGYLSPTSCATLFAGSSPFWWFALKRVRQSLNSRMVPLVSVCAAFCFVIMMFNIPLPGGTSGHVVGMGVTAAVLGPWASILAVSVALLIQAVFFGDGGITAFGANSFNMAIVGSLISYGVYRVLSGASEPTSRRRIIAASAAGYLGINIAALLAGIEFGLQPLLFHDGANAPLYAPYPLRIAVPAMMLGHLTFAGLAEAIVSGGVIAWLQHSHVALLKPAIPTGNIAPVVEWGFTRPFWIGLAALMIATPLGLLAAGTAWGEWGAADFKNPGARHEIAAASLNVMPPEEAPVGMQRLSAFWTAPLPDYAPPFLKSPQIGYVLSAMLGVGLVILATVALERIVRTTPKEEDL
ncbi:MAG: cobalt transporter CbiM [Verrucomicrobiota bacterium]